jgi:excisionase family DNA binding protein
MPAPCTDFPLPARYVAIHDAARFANVSPRTLRRRIRSGDLAAFKVGSRLLLQLADVDALVKSHPVAASA